MRATSRIGLLGVTLLAVSMFGLTGAIPRAAGDDIGGVVAERRRGRGWRLGRRGDR